MKGKTLTLNKQCILITICFTVRIVAHAEALTKNCLIFIKKIPDGIKTAVTEVRSRMPHLRMLASKMTWGAVQSVQKPSPVAPEGCPRGCGQLDQETFNLGQYF